MGLGPIKTWSTEDVAGWLESVQLNKLAPLFRSNEVTGNDLAGMTSADLMEHFGCSSWQAKKAVTERDKLGGGEWQPDSTPRTAGAATAPPYSDTPPLGYPVPPYGAPAGFAGAAPAYPPPDMGAPPVYPPPPPAGYVPPTPPAAAASLPPGYAHYSDVQRLQQELEREKMKNELRKEFASMARRGSSQPIIVSNSNNNNNNNNNVQSGGMDEVVEMQYYSSPPAKVGTHCGVTTMLLSVCCCMWCLAACPLDEEGPECMPIYGYRDECMSGYCID